jgi:hypothetical protein
MTEWCNRPLEPSRGPMKLLEMAQCTISVRSSASGAAISSRVPYTRVAIRQQSVYTSLRRSLAALDATTRAAVDDLSGALGLS